MSNQFEQVIKFTGKGVSGSTMYFGQSISISADGNCIAVGGPSDSTSVGAVWIFRKVNDQWRQEAKLVPPTGTYLTNYPPQFGTSVSINQDGSLVFIGAPYDYSGTGICFGANWVFSLDSVSGAWAMQGDKLVSYEYPSTNTFQGTSVAMTPDGITAVSGSTSTSLGVTVYTRVTNIWVSQGSSLRNQAGNAASTVAITADGNLILIGGGGNYVSVYTRTENVWSLQQTMTNGGSSFGSSISLSANGNIAFIGQQSSGIAWIYKRVAGTFTQVGSYLVPQGASGGSYFGSSITCNAAGTLFAVGASFDNSGIGAVFVYSFNGTKATPLGTKIVAGDFTGTTLPKEGASLSMSAIGDTITFGGPNDKTTFGAGWIYSNAAVTAAPSLTPTAPTMSPTTAPTTVPTILPSTLPTMEPTLFPTFLPTAVPNLNPTILPSRLPTNQPSIKPSLAPIALAGVATASSLSMLSIIIIAVIGGLALMCTLLLIRYRLSRNYREADTAIGEMNEWIEDAKSNANHGRYIQLQHSSKQAKAEDPLLTDIYADNKRNDEML